jgi:hypothetical protein
MAELIRSWPNGPRAAHYLEQAGKLRYMAEAEPPGELPQLLAIAAQYAVWPRTSPGKLDLSSVADRCSRIRNPRGTDQ